MSRWFLILGLGFALAGCQKAVRYPAAPVAKAVKDKAEAKAVWGWAFPEKPPRDLPIRFVASDRPEWRSLPAFWNRFPSPATDVGTSHIGQSPLGILAGFTLLGDAEAIIIKVPRGLPDPTPLIPAANLPTAGKWQLGKKMFFDRILTAGQTSMACAECHQPSKGFVEANAVSLEGTRNTLSLINVAYNRAQFWDGRVHDLEEVLVHSLDDELDAGASRIKVLQSHRFGGIAKRIDQNADYRAEFRLVFGVERATQDAVAKALATYMRTILSGDSVYDRALEESQRAKVASPTAEHFKNALSDDALKRYMEPIRNSERIRDPKAFYAEGIAAGHKVFLGKGGCVLCHPPGIFTNQQFYNTLVGDSGLSQAVSGRETGRFSVLPIGLKDPAMRGAYRTPTLRNLSVTAPYFHNGSKDGPLFDLEHHRNLLDKDNLLLAKPFRDLLTAPEGSQAFLTNGELTDLAWFLRALDGQPVDSKVANKE